MKIRLIILFFLVCLFVGCRRGPSEDSINAGLAIFSSKDALNMSNVKKIVIDIKGRKVEFGNDEIYSVEDLRSVLNLGLISGGDRRIARFGARRERLGVINVITPSDQINIPLYKSNSTNNLYAVIFPQVDGHGESITYFEGSEIFEKYLSSAD
jgi:hypothetical protein